MSENDDRNKRRVVRPRRLDQRGVERSPENAQPVSYLDDGSYHDSDGMWHPNPNGLIGKMSQLSEAYMENGGIIPTLQMATGNWDGAGDTLKAVVNNMGKQAAIREQGLQQRLTHSNLEAEKRETIRTEYKARARFREREEAAKADRHSSETDDAIRKDWEKEKIRQEKELFNRIRIKKLEMEHGFWAPSATVTKQLAMNAEQEASQVSTAVGGGRSSKPVYVDLGNLSDDPSNRVTQLMGEWLKQGEVTLLCGNRGTGKSQMATQIGFELAKGGYSQLLEVPVEIRQKCIYLAYEMSYAQWGERYKNVAADIRDLVQLGFPVLERKNIKGALQDCRELCEEELQQGTHHLMIFIDNLAQLVKHPNNPSADEAKELVMGLKSLQAQYDSLGMAVTVMILVHTDKAGSAVKGSGTWEDCTDATIFISGEGVGAPRHVELSRSRSSGAPEPFFASIEKEPYLHFRRKTIEELQMEQSLAEAEKLRKLGYEFEEEEMLEQPTLPDPREAEKKAAVNVLLAMTALQASEPSGGRHLHPEQASMLPLCEKKPAYEFAGDKFDDLDRAEKIALYDIIKLEDERGTSGVDIINRVKNCFGVTLTGDYVSKVKRGVIQRPEEPKNSTVANVAKIIQTYLSDYPNISN